MKRLKTIEFFASTALVAVSFSPLATAPVMAAPANPTTESDMTSVCDANLAGRVADPNAMLNSGQPKWETTVQNVVETEGAPVETGRDIDESTRVGTGTVTYSGISIAQGTVGPDRPYRIGGSVNMFGDQIARYKHWSNSEYDYLGYYDTTTSYTFDCAVSEGTEVYHNPVYGPSYPGGKYINSGTNPSGGGGSCQGLEPGHPFWGTSFGNCTWVGDGTTIPGELLEPGYWEYLGQVDRVDLGSTGTASQVDKSTAPGHEVNGGPMTQEGSWLAAQVVICISPKKLPGTWTKQNGYTGVNCTTSWFNQAPWGGGSQDSQGTYISVPAT